MALKFSTAFKSTSLSLPPRIIEIGISKFFNSVNDYRSAKWRFNESKQLYYERKYHPTAEKAKNEFFADSTSLVMIGNDFKNNYPFTTLKDSSWSKYLTR